LTELDVSNFPNLKRLSCSGNLLTSLDLTKNLQLKSLSIRNNNFSICDLSFLSHLVNLRLLQLGNDNKERISQGIYNRFCGDLKPLKNMKKLMTLSISNTDLNNGVDYLPDSLRKGLGISHSTKERPNSKVKEIS